MQRSTQESTLLMGKLEQDIALLNQTVLSLTQQNSQLEISLEEAQKKISWFEEQTKLARHREYGKSSEASSSLQQQAIIFDGDEVAETFSTKKEEMIAGETEVITYERRKGKRRDRHLNLSQLPHYRVMHDLSEDEKQCRKCQGPLHKIRESISHQVEIIRPQLYVVEHVHPQYSCRQCVSVQSAEKPLSPIPKSMAGGSLLTDVIVNKYDYHLPLYRQSQMFKGRGIDIPDNTLSQWVMQSGGALRPLDEALETEITVSSYLQVDETPVKVLSPDKKGYMWVFLSPLPNHRLVRFQFSLSRAGEVVETALRNFKGRLQNDGYSGYNGMRRREEQQEIICLGCLSHSRRKFANVIKIGSTKSLGKAQEALDYFKRLYKIERQAKEEGLESEKRALLRKTEAIPILDEFYKWLIKTQDGVPPKSAIGEAVSYTLKQWDYLRKYPDYGEVEVDTNWVENQIRPFAVGRSGWLFIGHEGSGQIGALLYSLIQSAKLNNLNPRIYLHYILMQVHALRKRTVEARDLLPHRIDRSLLQAFADREFEKAKTLFSSSLN